MEVLTHDPSATDRPFPVSLPVLLPVRLGPGGGVPRRLPRALGLQQYPDRRRLRAHPGPGRRHLPPRRAAQPGQLCHHPPADVRLGGRDPRRPLLLRRLPRRLVLYRRRDRPGPRGGGDGRPLPAPGLHHPGGHGRHAGPGPGLRDPGGRHRPHRRLLPRRHRPRRPHRPGRRLRSHHRRGGGRAAPLPARRLRHPGAGRRHAQPGLPADAVQGGLPHRLLRLLLLQPDRPHR